MKKDKNEMTGAVTFATHKVDFEYDEDTSARLTSITIELISPSASCGRKLV